MTSKCHDPAMCRGIAHQRSESIRNSLAVDDNKPDLLADLHTEADLGEGSVPVGGQFSLF